MGDAGQVPDGVDVTRPSAARLYDYCLGGSRNFEVDRVAAERLRLVMPELADAAWANRGFHQRAARWIATRGIRQFIDIGCGLPTSCNTHQVLEAVPAARVVYADIDPMVAAHADGLLTDRRSTRLVTADLREPGTLLTHPDLRALIDFGQPTGLLMTAALHFVADTSDPWGLVRRYLTALAPGSYLALSHGTGDKLPPGMVQAARETYACANEQFYPRSRPEQERFFAGLDLVEPYPGAGLVLCHLGLWGADDPATADSDGSRIMYCGVARRP